MYDRRRVDLIFPRSGQILPIYVPETMVDWVTQRNIQVLYSLYGMDVSRYRTHYPLGTHPKPS